MSARADAASATAERLLAAAWRHFATRPYEHVRLREIAAEAGVTVQTLHLRFHSKDELLSAAYAWFGRQEIASRPPAPAADVPEALTMLFDRYEEHGQAVLRMLSQEERIPAIKRMTDAGRAYHRYWVQTTFDPQLEGLSGERYERRLATILLATDLLAWKLLRQDMQLDRENSEQIIAEMIQSLRATQ
ncbi:MAG TPA: helix-turn-helix domain-containing protein [Solirubrobacteraceae bacterium]|jgi:AcrR family transcriptional regulator